MKKIYFNSYCLYLNGFLKNLTLNPGQNHLNLSLLGYSRYLFNLLCLQDVGKGREQERKVRQIFQNSHSFMQYPGQPANHIEA